MYVRLTRHTEIPDGPAVLPPGPGLAAALGAIELAGVPNDRVLALLRAIPAAVPRAGPDGRGTGRRGPMRRLPRTR